MDFSEIKKFIIERGDRFIMAENGKPAVVLMSFSDYAKLCASPKSRMTASGGEAEGFDSRSLAEGWEAGDAPETELLAEEGKPPAAGRRLDQIRLEDLPL